MGFNLLDEAMAVKQDGLFLVVLGPSGSGKSHFTGTYPGKTLILYGAGESHGPASALKSNGNIVPIMWDRIKVNNKIEDLPADAILPRIKQLLDPEMLKLNGVKCVVIDSITNLCNDIKRTVTYKQRCLNNKGQHNPFKETEALIEILSSIVSQLQLLSDYHNIDSITTMDLNIQSVSTDGYILESRPGLPAFGVGKAIIQQYPDILVLNRRGAHKSVFENMSQVSSKSSDINTKEMVKYLEYHPRLRKVDELPETIEASVAAILKLKGLL